MTAQRDEQWLRDRLAGAVPDAPVTPDRAARARDRHRRAVRRTATLTVAAAIVAVLAVALPLTWTHAAGGRVTPSNVPTTDPCPPPGNWMSPARPSGPATLPDGAAWIRLCPGPGLLSPSVPEGVLTTDAVGRLVAEVNARPTADPTCSDDSDVRYWLTFGYSDGTTRPVLGEWDHCARLYVGDSRRDGGDQVLNDFLAALTAQRGAQTPPIVPPRAASCDFGLAAPFLADAKDTTQAVLCVQHSTADTGAYTSGLTMAVPIPASDLRTLLDDWIAHQGGPHQRLRTEDCPGAAPSNPGSDQVTWTIDGVTAWGDDTQILTGPFGVWIGVSGSASGIPGDSGQATWFAGCPSAASEAILNRLIAQVPTRR